jgi:hypothetical protein
LIKASDQRLDGRLSAEMVTLAINTPDRAHG